MESKTCGKARSLEACSPRCNGYLTHVQYPLQHSGDGLKYLFTQVREILLLAQKYNGIAFGGFVRDVVTKVLEGDLSDTEVKDVDIWFKNDSECKEFVEEGKRLGKLRDSGVSCYGSGGFKVQDCLVLRDFFDTDLIYVDTVVSAQFPVNDFDVNDLIWFANFAHVEAYIGDLEQILASIKNKRAELKPVHKKLLESGGATGACVRVCERFLSKGWTLTFQGRDLAVYSSKTGEPVSSNVSDHGPFYFKTIKNEAVKVAENAVFCFACTKCGHVQTYVATDK